MKILAYGKRTGALLVTPILAFALAACGGPATNTATAIPAEPTGTAASNPTATVNGSTTNGNATGTIVLYTTRSEALIKPVIDAFQNANPGTEIKLLSGSGGELSAKLLEERNNPQADLYINTDLLNMASLAQEGIFSPLSIAQLRTVPEKYRADDSSWTALTLRARVIMYNTNLVKPEELPSSVLDLTDPKWKGQVGSANSTNGAIQAHMVAMRNLLGAEKTEEFIKGLVANDTKFFGGHTDVRKAVGAGELKLGFVNHYYYQLSKAEGAPVGVIYPDQESGEMGVVVNTTNAGIIKGGANPELAEAFVSYLLTPEGQKIFADLNYEYPVISGVALAKDVTPLDGIRQADIDLKTLWDELPATKELMQGAGLP